MLHSHDHQKKPTISRIISQFVQKNRILFLILAVLLFLLPLGYLVVQQIDEKSKNDATTRLYELEKKYEEYSAKKDGEDAVKAKEEFLAYMQDTISGFNGRSAEYRAREIIADMNLEEIAKEDTANKAELLKETLKEYLIIIEKAPEFALMPKFVLVTGRMIEGLPARAEKEGTDKIEISVQDLKTVLPAQFQKLGDVEVETYSDFALSLYLYSSEKQPKSPFILETLVNIGRLYEKREMREKAIEVYEKLERDFSNNDWTNIAINRRIALQAKE
ncbi:MAG: hypothetical protein JW904_15605 [Spirochaetales bacterium]|nr:hypothetical protein [Spirochaetales bacterium]